jgi:uncharacterized cofD-like protein
MRIVTLGGGTGQAQLVRGLVALGADVTAIAGVTDNGGHSGELRKELGIPAVGDLRSCLAALGEGHNGLARALNHRFASGASLGNLILAQLAMAEGSLTRAASALSSLLAPTGRALPVSDAPSQIAVRLATGKSVVGEWEIIRRKPRGRIVRLFHRPAIDATPEARRAIREADLVVIGPGSLRTALVSVLLVRGIREAARRKRVAFVLNILTQAGQTDGFTAADHVAEIGRYLGKRPEIVIANSKRPPAWALQGAEFVDPEGVATLTADLLEPVRRSDLHRRARPGPFIAGPHLVRHDSRKLANLVLKCARRPLR